MLRNLFVTYQAPEDDAVASGGAESEAATLPSADEYAALLDSNKQMQASNMQMQTQMNELLNETKTAKAAKRKAEDETALEHARKTQTLEEFEKTKDAQFATERQTFADQLASRDEIILGGSSGSAIKDLASKFRSPKAAELMLKSLVKSVHGEGGGTVTSFYDTAGNLITTDVNQMHEWLGNNEDFKPMMNGIDSRGAADGNSSPANQPNHNGTMSDKEKRIAAINAKFN